MSLWICPLCGKQNSLRHYDPTDFEDDILIIRLRGLGQGKGFKLVEEYSLLDGDNPELLDLISDRVTDIYDLLYEDDNAEEEEHTDNTNSEPLSALDKELLEGEDIDFNNLINKELFGIEDDEEEENVDINDFDEDIIE